MKKISFCCNLLVCQSLVEQFISYYFQAVNREMKTSPWQRRLFEFILTSNFCFSNFNLIRIINNWTEFTQTRMFRIKHF